MIRILMTLAVLSAWAGTVRAGELDREAPGPLAVAPYSVPVVRPAVAAGGSELDDETPEQSWCRRGWVFGLRGCGWGRFAFYRPFFGCGWCRPYGFGYGFTTFYPGWGWGYPGYGGCW